MTENPDRTRLAVEHHKLRDRVWLERQVSGALASAIDAHGPVTRSNRDHAIKRVVAQIYSGLNDAVREATLPPGDPGRTVPKRVRR